MPSTAAEFETGTWYHEKLEEGLVLSYEVNRELYKANSPFQELVLLDTKPFGHLLVTDGLMQSSCADEFVYHEALVHPSLTLHGSPKRVYIGGGGEGATLREVLKHKSVEEVVMVDIDGALVEMCKEHMPTLSDGTFADPRTKLIIGDAKQYLEEYADGSFDVIILDLSDPLDGGPCYQLYTTQFYAMCAKKLTTDGLLVTQSGCASVRDVKLEGGGVFSAVHNTLKQVFPRVAGYSTLVPSFMSEWGFNVAAKNAKGPALKTVDVDAGLAKQGATSLAFYDQETHTRMVSLVKPIREVLSKETRVMTVENPLFMTAVTTGIL